MEVACPLTVRPCSSDRPSYRRKLWRRAGAIAAGACAVLPASGLAQAPSGEAPVLRPPIRCDLGRDCFIQNYVDDDPSPGAKDYRGGGATYDKHTGVDFRVVDMRQQRRGVEVVASAAGRVLRTRDGVPDVLLGSQPNAFPKGQDCGNGVIIAHGGGWETQYCHLARGSLRVRPGQTVAGGEALGLVGASGAAAFPHVHITVRHNGTTVDPFCGPEPGVCREQASLWAPAARAGLAYRQRVVLNLGFANRRVEPREVEDAAPTEPVTRQSEVLIGYVRSILLAPGDVESLSLVGPDGQVVASSQRPALQGSRAQSFLFVGRRRSGSDWPPGAYRLRYQVQQGGRVVAQRQAELKL